MSKQYDLQRVNIKTFLIGHFQRNVQGNKYVKNYEFSYNFPTWGTCHVTMTSVLGHLTTRDFDPRYKSWQSCDPSELFEAPIETLVAEDKIPIAKNIEACAATAHYLFIWTDCDREGENIGAEIRDCALKRGNRLTQPGKVVRARFSNIERAHIQQAARNPVTLDEHQASAVYARIELDLRIGACFTRNLTLSLEGLVPSNDDRARLISYGSCQFPTLGFVVERYMRVRNFVPETFWSIKVMHQKDGIKVNFKWARGHLFDRMMVVILFERCLLARTATVTKVQTRPTSKWRPLPLTTVELQKCGSRFLRMDSQRVMQHAEKLYQNGFISYPRTETDQFDRGMDLISIIQKQAQQQARWGQYAQALLNGGFQLPRSGRHDDKAHPPIHPVNYADASVLSNEEQRVYEFVVRRFLACCSDDARGSKTEIKLKYGSEAFGTSGLTVLERNYLDVYPYDKWTSSQELPDFREGESFEPTEALMHDGETSPPGYLTEPELIALMDANGIGTDATMAEHIVKIKQREYVSTRPRGRQQRGEVSGSDDDSHEQLAAGRGRGRGDGRGRGRGGRAGRGGRGGAAGGSSGVQEFIPTTLGVALVQGYESMGHEISLAKPFLRKQVSAARIALWLADNDNRQMEQKMSAICEGRTTKNVVVQETIEQYRAVYRRTQQGMNFLKAVSRSYDHVRCWLLIHRIVCPSLRPE